MKNEDLLVYFNNKFDEVNDKINNLDVKISGYWHHTLFQYVLFFMVLVLFITYEVRLEYVERRKDNPPLNIIETNVDNKSNSSSNIKQKKASSTINNTTSKSKKVSFFGN